MLNKKALAGTPSTPPVYVEDVFSTYLFAGSSSSKTIINGIDLAGEGGMVWLKGRNANDDHVIYDTARGSGYPRLYPNTSGPQATTYPDFDSFNSNGFTIGYSPDGGYSNVSGTNYVSWTFRKAPKFFDIVTYTGDGSTSKLVNHSLESTPGMIMIKRLNGTGNWFTAVGLGSTAYGIAGGGGGSGYEIALNRTDGYYDNPLRSTIATSTTVDVPKVYYNDATKCNASGATYVMYLFASNAGGFGAAGTDNIITCGSFTGASPATVNLGYEPQWLLIKSATNADNWYIFDTMRGWTANNSGLNYLIANSSGPEQLNGTTTPLTSTGFQFNYGSGQIFTYVAIRRPMKTPTDATKVFNPVYGQSGAPGFRSSNFNAGIDTSFVFVPSGYNDGTNAYPNIQTRLIGTGQLQTANTRAEVSQSYNTWDYMNGQNNSTFYDSSFGSWLFKRATGFHDVVCYTGNDTARTITHNLGVAPEFMIVKRRNAAGDNWAVYSSATQATKWMQLEDTAAASTASTIWNDTAPTSSVFSVGSSGTVNASGGTYVAYLFSTLAGISKVGSYTGTGSAQTINCGFTAGARFVLIKRTDDTGNWYVWDTVRGIVSGNDPYLLLNTYGAQVTNTDYIDPANSGFEISSTAPAAINANGGSFIFLAIA